MYLMETGSALAERLLSTTPPPGNGLLRRIAQDIVTAQSRNRILPRPLVALESRPPRLTRRVRLAISPRPNQLMPSSPRVCLPEVNPLLFARRWQTRQDRADDSAVEILNHADGDQTVQWCF